MKWIGVAGAAGAAGMAAVPSGNAYYQGPVSDHFDGERFFNPGGKGPKGFLQLARWSLFEPSAKWPAAFPSPHDTPTEVKGGVDGVTVLHIGHASFLIRWGAINLLIDPVFAQRASPVSFAGPVRVNPPAMNITDLPRIDAVFVTHNHYDHMDMPSLAALEERHRPHFFTPLGNDTIIKNSVPAAHVTALDWDQSVDFAPLRQLAKGLTITAVPTQHWSARGTRDRMHALWASFIISDGTTTVYAVGDTGFGDGRTFRHVRNRHRSIDLALLPIGAYEPRWFMSSQHMNPAEAVEAFRISGARRALGHHWGTFKLTNEAIDAPVKALREARITAGLSEDAFMPVQPGFSTSVTV